MLHNLPVLYRALIKTHHMTSRKKIQSLTRAAKGYNCAVVIKTGRPPGVMLAESTNRNDIEAWVQTVRRLRYKDYSLMKMESVGQGQLKVEMGHVQEFQELKDFGRYLEECSIWQWWREHMGFAKSGP